MDVLVATDFFTAEVWTMAGLVTYGVLFFMHLGSRQLHRAGVTPHPPNLHVYTERWVRSVKDEALSRMILFGERSLQHVLKEYVTHVHHERPYQGKGNMVLIPALWHEPAQEGALRCRERLGGFLTYYYRDAA
jgi:hypothetical protein